MMNNALFSLLFLLFSFAGNAQQTPVTTPTPVDDSSIRKTTEILTEKYTLSADQAKQMYKIQARKAQNLAEIAELQNSDPALYTAKVQNVQKSTLANIRRILQSKEQVEIYQKTQSEQRYLRNQKQKTMVAQKATKAAIDAALLAIYAE